MTIQTAHMTLGQAKEIARSIHAIRRDWDRPGIEDALGRARYLADAASVAIAAHRAAANPANRTPAIIALDGPHWRDAERPPHFAPPPAAERCSTCSEREDVCRARWADDHEFAPDLRPRRGDARTHVEGLRALRDNRLADLCSHHVPVTNCAECRQRTPEPSSVATSAPATGESDDRPETACAAPGCWRPTRDGICDHCRAAAAAEDQQAANTELIDRLHANEAERARTRPAPDPDAPEPRYFTSADYDPERVHAAQARAAEQRTASRAPADQPREGANR